MMERNVVTKLGASLRQMKIKNATLSWIAVVLVSSLTAFSEISFGAAENCQNAEGLPALDCAKKKSIVRCTNHNFTKPDLGPIYSLVAFSISSITCRVQCTASQDPKLSIRLFYKKDVVKSCPALCNSSESDCPSEDTRILGSLDFTISFPDADENKVSFPPDGVIDRAKAEKFCTKSDSDVFYSLGDDDTEIALRKFNLQCENADPFYVEKTCGPVPKPTPAPTPKPVPAPLPKGKSSSPASE